MSLGRELAVFLYAGLDGFYVIFWCNGFISDSLSGVLSFSSKANRTSSHFRTQRYLLLLGFWT